jgi:hypothetical protein
MPAAFPQIEEFAVEEGIDGPLRYGRASVSGCEHERAIRDARVGKRFLGPFLQPVRTERREIGEIPILLRVKPSNTRAAMVIPLFRVPAGCEMVTPL